MKEGILPSILFYLSPVDKSGGGGKQPSQADLAKLEVWRQSVTGHELVKGMNDVYVPPKSVDTSSSSATDNREGGSGTKSSG